MTDTTARIIRYEENLALYNAVIDRLEGTARSAEHAGQARADLAALRRGMGQPMGAVLEATRVIEPMLPNDTPDYVAETVYVVAPLFAHHRESHPDTSWWNNMGAHFLEMCEAGEPPPPNIQRHFEELLRSEPDDLAESLRQSISLLKQKSIAVNWRQLCRDVHGWLDRRPEGESIRRNIRLSWAKSFWRLPRQQRETNTPV